ncbi:MAG: endo alpha-1,4 polygalactosaminidase, partial [Planctomycetota bacterium]
MPTIIKTRASLIAALTLSFMAFGCDGVAPNGNATDELVDNDDNDPNGSQGETVDPDDISLSRVRSWAYQIQGLENDGAIDALAASSYDLLVIEPTETDRENSDFDAAAMVDQLKSTNGATSGRRKIVVAYVDIGEAEDWRYYWRDDWSAPGEDDPGQPDFLLTIDPDGWSGNYPVAFWDDRWKDIMIYDNDSMLQRVLDAGFDGIYMDWVEAYSDDTVSSIADAEQLDPREEMISFIREIAEFARAQNPDFYVIPQNSSEIVFDGEEVDPLG